jgi:hypothetical protein
MTTGDEGTEAEALRALARVLAPYVADELRSHGFEAPAKRASSRGFDAANAERYVQGLRPDVVERAIVFFAALAVPPGRIDSETLAAELGVSGRGLSGALLTPLKRRARKLGLSEPWQESESGRSRKVWSDRAGNSRRILQALERESVANRELHNLAAAIPSVGEPQHPVPTDVYVWQPKYADQLQTGPTGSSCLRDSRPGSRAVIYRASHEQGIVALFDVGEYPRPDPTWRWYAEGHAHVLPRPISREALLEDEALRDVFLHIQGRRRLPPRAQQALLPLLKSAYDDGKLPALELLPVD